MIEFVLKNRKFRLHPDGIMYVRAHRNGVETKNGAWKQVKFSKTDCKYTHCHISIDGVDSTLYQHRMVYYAYNQDWDLFDTSRDNIIDHINGNRSDNRIENLRKVTHQQNMWNIECKGYYKTPNGKYAVQIRLPNGKRKQVGTFKTEEDARNAYLEAKNTYHIIE
jgi:hypothetical protein